MKNTSKKILLTVCSILLVAASVMGTLAYFTSEDSAVNTFTVGKVAMTLDEAPTDTAGKVVPGDRVQGNKYRLVPGATYTKDPTVHMDPASESSWVFVKVENGIADIETAVEAKTIAYQITKTHGWAELPDVEGIYYKAWNKGDEVDLKVFGSFTVDGDKAVNNGADGEKTFNIDDYNTEENAESVITITGYAIQMAGFEGEPVKAWGALKTQNNL